MLQTVKLHDNWEFRKLGEGKWLGATVPGCVHTDLMDNGVIDDAQFGMRELEQFWIGESDWEYRTSFKTPRGADAGARLVFEGLDTVAEIRLNGRLVAKTENMHRRYAFDVTDLLKPRGSNDLSVTFRSAVKAAQRLRAMQPKIDAFQHDRKFPFVDRKPTCRNFLRKAQYQWDWDWGLCQVTSGLWREVRLEVGPAFPDYVTTAQHHHDGVVDLDVTLHFTARAKGEGVYLINVAQDFHWIQADYIRWQKGANSVTRTIYNIEPKLWWPNGMGKQPLYTLRALLDLNTGGDLGEDLFTVERQIGFRDAKLVRAPDKDGKGESFGFTINGVPVFLKGANWVPASTLPSSVAPETYRFLLDSCVEANFNALRVWGGGVYESDLFYDLCDKRGILLWHDHMMACTCYPTAKPFVRELTAEIEHNVRRLQSHASLLLWCGDNEDEAAMQRWFRLQPNIEYLRREYYKLMEGPVRETTERTDPTRAFWLSSPSNGIGRKGDPYDHNFGDTHFWDVWFTDAGFARYREVRPRFVSEFGFQSFPHARTLAKWMKKEDLGLTTPVMEHHQRTPGGNGKCADMTSRYFRLAGDFDAFCYQSQLTEITALKTAVEHWRRIKPRCQGTLYWQLNDTWPTMSCASIDSELEWKAPHYAAKRFYAPVLGSFNPLGAHELAPVEVWATSDLHEPVRGSWRVDLVSVNGARRKVASGSFRLGPNASRRLAKIDVRKALSGLAPNEHFLHLTFKTGSRVSESTHTFGAPKLLDLKKPKLRAKVAGVVKGKIALDVSTDLPALFVELASEKAPGAFSDNYFDLIRGTRRVFFTPRLGMKPDTLSRFREGLTVRTLAD